MKTLTSLTPALLTGAVLLAISQIASAQTLVADNPDSAVNDTSVTVGSNGVLGYFFAQVVPIGGGSQGNITDYSDAPFISSVTPQLSASYNPGSGYATISADGTSYETGVYYSGSGTSSYQDVAKIQLTSSLTTVIPAFKLGVLTGSAGGDAENNDLYQLTLFTGDGTQIGSALQVNNASDSPAATTDDFFYATVTGATAGDYLELSAARNPDLDFGNNITFTGVTVSSVTPEPSTWALIVAGMGMLAVTTFRRRRS